MRLSGKENLTENSLDTAHIAEVLILICMNSAQFEREVCKRLSEAGYWALNIPRNHAGAQPFDIIAIRRGSNILALDAKVCQRGVLSASRIEDNQHAAFMSMIRKTNAIVGFVCFYNETLYYVPYYEFMKGNSQVKLTEWHADMWRKFL